MKKCIKYCYETGNLMLTEHCPGVSGYIQCVVY